MNWIEKQVRTTSLKKIIGACAVVGIIGGIFASQMRYFDNFIKGPQAISHADLAKVSDVSTLPRYWVTLDADNIADADFEEITTTKRHGITTSRKVTAHYFVATVDNRFLVVKAHSDTPTKSLKGALRPISGKVDQGFFDQPEVQAHKDSFYPMVLDTENFKEDGNIGLTVAALAILGSIIFGAIGFSHFRNPRKHSAAKKASDWGDLDQVAQQVEKEVNGTQALHVGNCLFTPDYIVQRSTFGFKLLRADDLLWAYTEVTKKKIYYVIPAGKSYALSINTANETLLISGKKPQIDAALAQIGQHKPWVIVGYSDELKKLYAKQRTQMAASVAQTRRDMEAGNKAA